MGPKSTISASAVLAQKKQQEQTSDYVPDEQTIKAIDQLRKFAQRQVEPTKEGKSDLFADEDEEDPSKTDLYLNFNFKKLYSHRAGIKSKNIPLPKSIYDPDNFKTCLIIRDNFITEDILNAIEDKKIPTLAKVIPFNYIKTVYNPLEKREELIDSYDFFVIDDALLGSLATWMGRPFLGSEKFPRIVRTTSTDNKKEFSLDGLEASLKRILSSASFLPPFSKEITVKVASLSPRFSEEEIVANINAVLKYFGQSALTSVGLKLKESPVLPLYYADRIYDDEDVLENVPEGSLDEQPKDDVLTKALLELTDEQTVSTLLGTRRVKRSMKDAGKIVKP